MILELRRKDDFDVPQGEILRFMIAGIRISVPQFSSTLWRAIDVNEHGNGREGGNGLSREGFLAYMK
jgi:hypothetical protein